jgi:hypothetical protein
MPRSRIPRFRMPAFDLPPCPAVPTPGTPLTTAQVRAFYEDWLWYSFEIIKQMGTFAQAWDAHYTQHGRPIPPLIPDTRPRRTAAQRPDTSHDTPLPNNRP